VTEKRRIRLIRKDEFIMLPFRKGTPTKLDPDLERRLRERHLQDLRYALKIMGRD
jgi:hypothetical protein